MNAIIEEKTDDTALAIRERLGKVEGVITEFDKVSAGLADLRTKYSGIVFDVSTTKGMKEACDARLAIREPRYAVEKVRKDAKAPVLALGKDIDARAKYITEALLELEIPIDDQIKAEEARKEAEKAARAAAERARVESIQERINEIRGAVQAASHSNSSTVAAHIEDIERMVIDDSFQEFKVAAQRAKDETLAALRDMHDKAKAAEEREAQIKAELAELENRRAEQARLEAEARMRREAEEREHQARLDAQRREEEARMAAEREAQERELAAQREAQRKAEDEARLAREAEERRIAAERAEVERQRREQEEREAAARAESERQRREAEEAAHAAEKKLRDAAPVMRDALIALRNTVITDEEIKIIDDALAVAGIIVE